MLYRRRHCRGDRRGRRVHQGQSAAGRWNLSRSRKDIAVARRNRTDVENRLGRMGRAAAGCHELRPVYGQGRAAEGAASQMARRILCAGVGEERKL